MPNLKTHCAISKKRTGYTFSKLHKWMDEPYKKYGVDHRVKRHTFNKVDLQYVRKNWGQTGIIEWLFHIAIDNLETAFKFERKKWNKGDNATNIMHLGFLKNKYICVEFHSMSDDAIIRFFEDTQDE